MLKTQNIQDLVNTILNNSQNRRIDFVLDFINSPGELFEFLILLLIKCITTSARSPKIEIDKISLELLHNIKSKMKNANIIMNYEIKSVEEAPDIVKQFKIVRKQEGSKTNLRDYSIHIMSSQYYIVWFDVSYGNNSNEFKNKFLL
jgi:hypothetical protein